MRSRLFVATTKPIYNAIMNTKIDTKPRPRGRPQSDNPASVTLPRVRVTPDKLAAYKQSADQSGKTFSVWIRDVLDKAAGKKK